MNLVYRANLDHAPLPVPKVYDSKNRLCLLIQRVRLAASAILFADDIPPAGRADHPGFFYHLLRRVARRRFSAGTKQHQDDQGKGDQLLHEFPAHFIQASIIHRLVSNYSNLSV